jgi:hypothetical protein
MNAFTNGFIKAARNAGLTSEGLDRVLNKVAASENLTNDELLAIRKQLATPQNIENYYTAPYQNYAAQLLSERDKSLNNIPELAAVTQAAKSGIGGAAMGGLAGYGTGSFLRSGNLLGSAVPYSVRKSLPTALGSSGAVLGALLKALPAYTDKLEADKALRKLHTPQNMAHVLNNVQMDRALLNA